MTIAEYGHVDLFRSGVLSNISSLGKIGHCMAELLQLPVSWRIIQFVRPPRTRPSTKTLDLRNLTSHRALDYTDQIWCSSE